MFPSLMPQMLGIRASLAQTIDMAARHGFVGADTDGNALLSLTPEEIAPLRDHFQEKAIVPGYIGLPPGRMPIDETQWDAAIAQWPKIAATARQLGYQRAAMVLLPFHESLDRDAALEEHVQRLKAITPILADQGIRLGLEYVAAPSRRAPYTTHTIWDLQGMLELLELIDNSSLGLMLDTFHWHGAGETAADLKKLRPEQIVVVHANDAPDVPLDEQVIMQRALPGATGVIDSAIFFQTLKELGYDGPVTCEPMQPAIDALGVSDEESILATVKRTLDSV